MFLLFELMKANAGSALRLTAHTSHSTLIDLYNKDKVHLDASDILVDKEPYDQQ